MKGKLCGVFIGLLAAIVCWFFLCWPMIGLGLQLFPPVSSNGHYVMAVGATLFSLFFTTLISIAVWVWVGRYIHKRHVRRLGATSILDN